MDARRGEQKGARDCTTRHRHLDTTALWAFPRAAMNVGSITQLTGYPTSRDFAEGTLSSPLWKSMRFQDKSLNMASVIRKFLAVLAGFGFAASIVAYLGSFRGVTLNSLVPWTFILHAGVFLFIVSMVLIEYSSFAFKTPAWIWFSGGPWDAFGTSTLRPNCLDREMSTQPAFSSIVERGGDTAVFLSNPLKTEEALSKTQRHAVMIGSTIRSIVGQMINELAA